MPTVRRMEPAPLPPGSALSLMLRSAIVRSVSATKTGTRIYCSCLSRLLRLLRTLLLRTLLLPVILQCSCSAGLSACFPKAEPPWLAYG